MWYRSKNFIIQPLRLAFGEPPPLTQGRLRSGVGSLVGSCVATPGACRYKFLSLRLPCVKGAGSAQAESEGLFPFTTPPSATLTPPLTQGRLGFGVGSPQGASRKAGGDCLSFSMAAFSFFSEHPSQQKKRRCGEKRCQAAESAAVIYIDCCVKAMNYAENHKAHICMKCPT